MQPKKHKIQLCVIIWFIIVAVYLGLFQLVQGSALANLATNIYSTNSTNNNTSLDILNVVVLSGTFVSCVCTSVFELCWISIIWHHGRKIGIVQAKSAKLGLHAIELQRQLNERSNRNIIHIGRPNNDESVYTELPNEREQLLRQSQLPNYQSTDTLPEHS